MEELQEKTREILTGFFARQDREALEEGRSFPAADRYLPLIYPELATAADYLPYDACVLFSESSRVGERAKTYQWQLEEDAKSLMERGSWTAPAPCWPAPSRSSTPGLSDWPTAYLDSFTLSAYPGAAPGLPACRLHGQASCPPSAPAWRRPVSDLDHYSARAWAPWCWCPANRGP